MSNEKLPHSPKETETEYVTVVAVGTNEPDAPRIDQVLERSDQESGFVTVLKIGDAKCTPNEIVEEVLVYRLPGERLGFGLKFEGGTKAAENVKRLYIQSCAPDSPASMVHCSWGKLTEGDQVLNIDSLPVTCMTRIDCVRCLKDSNVVIKLLVRHLIKNIDDVDNSARTEDLPLVISAEKKRTPPPPPPVPPRKIPRKLLKETAVPDTNGTRSRFQSPRSSGKCVLKPDLLPRYKDGNGGPPDAEVYLDLFSLETGCNLSESDDTGSSISTIIDRFGSYPTTTNSSLAGSLPSTPTFVQKQLDPGNDEIDSTSNKNYLFGKFDEGHANAPLVNKAIKEEESPLQPPTSFRDAPLSYGTEKVGVATINKEDENGNCLIINKENCEIDELELPRLVRLVPKLTKVEAETRRDISETINTLKMFLDNESRYSEELFSLEQRDEYILNSGNSVLDLYNNSDLYNHSWNLSAQLDTIGEVDEEQCQDAYLHRSVRASTPIVIIDNADKCDVEENLNLFPDVEKSLQVAKDDTLDRDLVEYSTTKIQMMEPEKLKLDQLFADSKVSTLSTRTKTEAAPNSALWKSNSSCFLFRDQQSSCSFRDKLAFFSNSNSKSSEDLQNLIDSVHDGDFQTNRDDSGMSRARSSSDLRTQVDCAPLLQEKYKPKHLHSRSQSLMDITSKKDRWFALTEQRQKSLSKLKGLVIPERVVQVDAVDPVDLPEIKSGDISTTLANNLNLLKLTDRVPTNVQRNSIVSHPAAWANNIAIYSPTTLKQKAPFPASIKEKDDRTIQKFFEFGDSPKSLESITSPTRSDCSFEYLIGGDVKFKTKTNGCSVNKRKEDESDNDSAVSSSQSSYSTSRISPPTSPKLETYNDPDHFEQSGFEPDARLTDSSNHRLLKAESVEAINRKNILASAKRRSGQDLKNGSPLIRKKLREERIRENCTQLKSVTPKNQNNQISFTELVKPNKNSDKDEIIEKENVQFLSVANSKKDESCKELICNLINSYDSKTSFFKPLTKNSSSSVTDLRKTFEKLAPTCASKVFKINSDTIKEKVGRNSIINKSSPSLKQNIKPEKERKPETNNGLVLDAEIITLSPQIPGGSVGITLAGGSDYENKNITVYKIRDESSAHRDGRLKKGDRVLSINNKSVQGLTHKQLVALLKEPLPQVTLSICRSKEVVDTSAISNSRACSDPSPIQQNEVSSTKSVHVISLVKDAAGLGLSLKGGQDSPLGDMPLQIKKIFKGGVAEKCENLKVGDEIILINEIDVTTMSRFQAWSVLKKLSEGESISLTIKR